MGVYRKHCLQKSLEEHLFSILQKLPIKHYNG